MNTDLAATYQYSFGLEAVLWYGISNSYSVVDNDFRQLLERYIMSKTLDDFFSDLNLNTVDLPENHIVKTITDYLERCNQPYEPTVETPYPINKAHRSILKQYKYNGKTFQIYFDSERVQNLIHPALAYLETGTPIETNIIFDIYVEGNSIYLFKDDHFISSSPKQDYHKLQGKFIIHLLGYIHDIEPSDWIGSFHGSTITDETTSILFVGQSGKGKSTLSAILAANGYKLLADDVSPLGSKTTDIYSNPAAISIKSGAFKRLQPMYANFDTLPTLQLSRIKGPIKYVAPAPLSKQHYPCCQIIRVNYQKEATTTLTPITIGKVLETLVPESWLSPQPTHAKQFLDWLQTLAFYELTYSSTTGALKAIKTLFDDNKVNY